MSGSQNDQPLLQVQNLHTYFYTLEGMVRAVDDVSFVVRRGETLGVVGESGCGKSVTALSIMNLLPKRKGKIEGGTILYDRGGEGVIDLATLPPQGRRMRSIRGNDIAMIFQEPMTSLNPVYTIGWQIREAIIQHRDVSKREAHEAAVSLLRRVGISAPETRVNQYPFELSGGMRQRAMIAMALACDPELLIADEPTTALDVTVQAQILSLLMKLKEDSGLSLMMITHDLGVIGEMADRVIVMYMGQIVEAASIQQLFYETLHPYTKALLRSLPLIGYKRNLSSVGGSVPSPYELPQNCRFRPRCQWVTGDCRDCAPELVDVGDGHLVRCHLFQGQAVVPQEAREL